MKKKIVKILLILIMILSVIPIYPKAEESAKKGDLRCPKTQNGNKYCKEYKDSNGKVYKTEVTASDGNVKVTKIVERTENVGRFAVHFRVEGNTTPIPLSGYVVILYDTSGSQEQWMMNGNYFKDGNDATVPAIKKFASELKKDGYKYAMVQFGENVSNKAPTTFINRDLTDKDFCIFEENPDLRKCNMGGYSRMDVGLNKALELFNGLDENNKKMPKYVVIFGDGEYMNTPNTDWGSMVQYRDELGKLGNIHFFGIRYPGTMKDGVEKINKGNNPLSQGGYDFCKNYIEGETQQDSYSEKKLRNINFTSPLSQPAKGNNNQFIFFKNSTGKKDCDLAIMSYLVHESEGKGKYIEADTNDFYKSFGEVRDNIKKESEKYKYSGNLIDKIGNDFSKVKNAARTIDIPIENLPYTTVTEDYDYINIDSESKTGWHATNDGFKFRYSYDGINYIDVSSNVNPEVYWEQEKGWQSCSDYASSSSDSSYIDDYIERTCSQIDGDGMRGFYALLTTNGTPINTKMISLTSGTGFPLTIDIESRVQCTYKFNVDNFNRAYNNKLQEIRNSQNLYEEAEKTKELNEMVKSVDAFINQSSKIENLQNYQKSLDTLDAVLQVKFKSSTKDIKLQSSSPSINEIKCSSDAPDKSITLDGKRYDVYTNRNCVFKYKKSLNIPTHCLSMYNGNMEECSATANNLINGGNKFYPDTNETSGYISVTLKNATYAGSTINLKGDKKSDGKNYDCQLSLSPIKPVIYRQIELADPFVQSYTKKQRNIGKNWINSNYNFVNIIKSDIWDSSKNYDYQYLMSKVDVENIKKDTKEIGIKSYLGRNCSFNSNNKYVCEFVRPNSSGKNQFFYKISGKALNISNE